MRVDAAPQRHYLDTTLPSTYTSVKPCKSASAKHVFEVDGEGANHQFRRRRIMWN
jgi:hypothetical protein